MSTAYVPATSEASIDSFDAEQHIDELKQSILREFENAETVGHIARNALEFLSSDQFSDPLHFVLEFLQNIDDAPYHEDEATLPLTW